MTNPVGVAEGSGCGNPLSPLAGLLPMGAVRFPRPDGRGYPLSPLHTGHMSLSGGATGGAKDSRRNNLNDSVLVAQAFQPVQHSLERLCHQRLTAQLIPARVLTDYPASENRPTPLPRRWRQVWRVSSSCPCGVPSSASCLSPSPFARPSGRPRRLPSSDPCTPRPRPSC